MKTAYETISASFGIINYNIAPVKSQIPRDNYEIIGDSLNIYKSVDDILKQKNFQDKVVYVDLWELDVDHV